jgi:hypothetical protein
MAAFGVEERGRNNAFDTCSFDVDDGGRRKPHAAEAVAAAERGVKYYPSGHMVYLKPDELAKMHADLAAWYDETLASARSARPPARLAARTGEAGRSPN